MPFTAAWMDLEIIILSELNQKEKSFVWYHLYMESKRYDTNELVYKTEIDSQT